jgi:hypothetical protein
MKNPLENETKALNEKLDTLRGEAKLKLHLAALDLKSEWNKLEPELDKLQDAAKDAGEASHKALVEGVSRLEKLLDRAGSAISKDS